MPVEHVRWTCPACGEELLVVAGLPPEKGPKARGGRPRGSRNKPKDEPAPKGAVVGIAKGGD